MSLPDGPLWPIAECTHPPEYRAEGHDVLDEAGELLHRVPEHCTACGYTIAPPAESE